MTRTLSQPAVLYRLPARLVSLALASVLSGLILILPTIVLGGSGELNHNQLMLLMWGIAAGFVHGVGFVPRNAILQVLLGPAMAWLLMLGGSLWIIR